MEAKEKFEEILENLNLYEFVTYENIGEIRNDKKFKNNKERNLEIENDEINFNSFLFKNFRKSLSFNFILVIDYGKEFLDFENITFERFLKDKCPINYIKAMSTRLTLAPIIKVTFEGGNLTLDVYFPNDEHIDLRFLKDIESRFVDLTKDFIEVLLEEVFKRFTF